MLEMSEQPRMADERQDRPGINQYLLAMSHELRTPLNAVIGMSGLLLDGELSAKQRHYVKGIHAAGETLAAILNDVLDLSRSLTGRLVIEPIPFDLRSMVEETAKILSTRAEERSLTLRVDWRPDLPRHVVGDPGRTRQVLANLIGHAIGSTSQGEVVVRVSADGEHAGVPAVRFTIEDTGIGMPPERLRRIFDQYVPVDAFPYRSFGITGLGLRISAELVRCLGGEIGADSDLGKGSRFWFVLPMRYAEAGAETIVPRVAPVRGGRVLLVELDPAARERYAEQVDAAGWDMACADDLGDSLEQLREAAMTGAPFQACVFSDYAVRPIHAEVATRLKADERLAPVALVMLTAVGSPGEAKKLWHAGFAAYLRKPVPHEELRETLTALAQVGHDGRGPSLITRHSLAEARSAQPFETDGIDAVLASLTAPATRSALMIGLTGSDQIEITETFAQVGVGVAPANGADVALARLSVEHYDFILFDADQLGEAAPQLLTSLQQQLGVDSTIPVIALSANESLRQRLIETAADEVLAKPVRRSDLELIVRRWTDRQSEPTPDAAVEPETTITDLEPVAAEQLTLEPVEPTTIEASLPTEDPEPVAPIDAIGVAEPPTIEPVDAEIAAPVVELAPAEEPVAKPPCDPITIDLPAESHLAPVGDLDGTDGNGSVDGTVAVEIPEGLVTAESSPHALNAVPVEGFEGNGVGHLLAAAVVEPVEFAPVGETVVEGPASIGLDEPSGPQIEDVTAAPLEASSEEPAPAWAEAPAPESAVEAEAIETSAPEAAITPEPPELAKPATADAEAVAEAEPVADEPAREPVAVEASVSVPVVSAAMMEQLALGGGFGLQHLIVTFVRETPARIADLATAFTRGDGSRLTQSLGAVRRLANLAGAERLAELCVRTEQATEAGEMEAAAGMLGEIEQAFLEVRTTIDSIAPPLAAVGDLPSVNATFLDQLSPEREGASRMLATRLADTFKTDGPARLNDLRQAVEREDCETSQRLAQSMKGMCGLIGAEPMAKLCALVEADARLKRIGQSRRSLEQLSLELDRVLSGLQRTRG